MRLEGRSLACERGEARVFSEIDFELGSGEVLALHGPNGAGKSSLLRLIAGLLRPVAGEILVDGNDVADDWPAFQRQLHYCGHLDGIKPALSVAENLAFWARLAGGPKSDPRVALAQMGIADLADIPARFLSAGQKRRLALARLAAAPRALWLLDEPTVALDLDACDRFAEMSRSHLRAGGLVIAATHAELGFAITQTLDFGDLVRPCAAFS